MRDSSNGKGRWKRTLSTSSEPATPTLPRVQLDRAKFRFERTNESRSHEGRKEKRVELHLVVAARDKKGESEGRVKRGMRCEFVKERG